MKLIVSGDDQERRSSVTIEKNKNELLHSLATGGILKEQCALFNCQVGDLLCDIRECVHQSLVVAAVVATVDGWKWWEQRVSYVVALTFFRREKRSD